MASLTAPSAPAKPTRKTFPPVEARGCLTTGEDRWGDLFAGVAILSISRGDETDTDTTVYWCRVIADAGRIVAIDLTRFATSLTYRVGIDPETGLWECDCPDAVYRDRRDEHGCACKHVRGLRDGLRHLEPMPERRPQDRKAERCSVTLAESEDYAEARGHDDELIDLAALARGRE